MRILVCGGRDYLDIDRVTAVLNQHVELCNPFGVTIIQGGAKGADFLAKAWAYSSCYPMEEYPADWKQYGKAAGYKRNKQMLEEGKPDLVIAFPGGNGTADMIRQAKQAGVEVVQVV